MSARRQPELRLVEKGARREREATEAGLPARSDGLPHLLTVKQTQELLQYETPQAVYNRIHDGTLPVVKIGGRYWIKTADLLGENGSRGSSSTPEGVD